MNIYAPTLVPVWAGGKLKDGSALVKPTEYNYNWSRYNFTNSTLSDFGIHPAKISAVFYCPCEKSAKDAINNQKKARIEFEYVFFYIYPISETFRLSKIGGADTELRKYAVIQLGKYRQFSARETMELNLKCLLEWYKKNNIAIKDIQVNSTYFSERAEEDNDFTAQYVAEVSVSGTARTVFTQC